MIPNVTGNLFLRERSLEFLAIISYLEDKEKSFLVVFTATIGKKKRLTELPMLAISIEDMADTTTHGKTTVDAWEPR